MQDQVEILSCGPPDAGGVLTLCILVVSFRGGGHIPCPRLTPLVLLLDETFLPLITYGVPLDHTILANQHHFISYDPS